MVNIERFMWDEFTTNLQGSSFYQTPFTWGIVVQVQTLRGGSVALAMCCIWVDIDMFLEYGLFGCLSSILGSYVTFLMYLHFMEGVWILSDLLEFYAIEIRWKVECLLLMLKTYIWMLKSENTIKTTARV